MTYPKEEADVHSARLHVMRGEGSQHLIRLEDFILRYEYTLFNHMGASSESLIYES